MPQFPHCLHDSRSLTVHQDQSWVSEQVLSVFDQMLIFHRGSTYGPFLHSCAAGEMKIPTLLGSESFSVQKLLTCPGRKWVEKPCLKQKQSTLVSDIARVCRNSDEHVCLCF
jgi:hypothetical protein